MPRIDSFDGITIYMYADDHNPPHVHAYYGDDAVLVAIQTRAVLAGSLASRQMRAVRAYVVANETALMLRWQELNG